MLDYAFHLKNPLYFFISMGLVLVSWFLHSSLIRPVGYTYSLGNYLTSIRFSNGQNIVRLINALRLLALFSACFILTQPQLIDLSSVMPVHGNDMMLVLDVSGSMYNQDDIREPRRLEIAKKRGN